MRLQLLVRRRLPADTPMWAKLMFDEFLYPVFKKYDAHGWRRKNLWQEEIDYVVKISLPSLKDVYKKNAGRKSVT